MFYKCSCQPALFTLFLRRSGSASIKSRLAWLYFN